MIGLSSARRILQPRRIAQIAIVALPLIIAFTIAKRAVDVPYWDEWEWADLVYKMHLGTLQFSDVWAQHSEHRMLFPNLIMLGLAHFGGWHPVREQFFSLAILIVSQIMIVTMIRRTARTTIAAFGALAASFVLFGLWQWENLSWGFQTAWFLCDACAIGVALLLARPDRRFAHVGLAIVVALIGTYSSSQGLVIWAVGAVALLLTGKRGLALLGVWIPAALIAFYVYRHGMYPTETGHVNVLTHPLLAVRYILSYLGAPMARWLGASGSQLAGLAGLVALGAALTADLRSPLRARRFARAGQWYALAVFPLLCAIGTSTGRAGFGVDQALASRYTTIAGLLWVALVGIAVVRYGRTVLAPSRPQLERLALAAAAFGFFVGANSMMGSSEWKSTEGILMLARDGLNVSDPGALTRIYPDPSRVIMLIGEMRTVHDGLFAP